MWSRIASILILALLISSGLAFPGGSSSDPVQATEYDGETYTADPISPSTPDTTGWATLSLGDDQVRTIAITPTYFFDATYDTLYVSSNGFVGFQPVSSGCCSGGTIPSADGIDGIIAGVWTDLDPSACGRVAYRADGSGTVVSFENVGYFGSCDHLVSFWIEILPSGIAQVHLLRVDGGPTATTGIESPSDANQTAPEPWGLELRRTTSALSSPLAWLLTPVGVGESFYTEAPIAPQTVDITDWDTLSLLTDDVVSLDIPATPFYKRNATVMHVSSNGFLGLDDLPGHGCCAGGDIPAEDGVDGIVAALWTDLDPKRCGTVAYNLSDGIRVAFVGVPYYGSDCSPNGDTATFWIGIDTDGTIEIHLLEAAGGSTATTGVETPDGSEGNLTRQSSGAVTGALAWRYELVHIAPPGPPEPEPPEPVEPRAESFTYEGRIACGLAQGPVNANDVCGPLGDASASRFIIPFDRQVASVHLLMEWDTADFGAEQLDFRWATPGGLQGGVGTSPLLIDVPVDPSAYWYETGINATALVGLASNEGLVIDQPFSICVVVLYGDAELPEERCAAVDEE